MQVHAQWNIHYHTPYWLNYECRGRKIEIYTLYIHKHIDRYVLKHCTHSTDTQQIQFYTDKWISCGEVLCAYTWTQSNGWLDSIRWFNWLTQLHGQAECVIEMYVCGYDCVHNCAAFCVCVSDSGIIQTLIFLRLWQLALAVVTAGISPCSLICSLRLRLWQTLIEVFKYGNGVL